MPVEKSSSSVPHYHTTFGGELGRKLLWTLFGIFLAYLIVLAGVIIRNEIRRYDSIGKAPRAERLLVLDAVGVVPVTPDVASTIMGVVSQDESVTEAQARNTKIMNTLITRLKALGVAPADIQTQQYSVYPQYDYSQGSYGVIKGYEVSQNVNVKIRDLTSAASILGLAGEVGANSVSGISFSVDERDSYLAAAREEALEKILEKAQALQTRLGVQFGGVVSYNEYENGVYPMYMDGKGGGGAPNIESGSTEVSLTASVTFELK